MTKSTRFYVIEKVYTGPNRDEHADDDTVIISTSPAHTNMSHEVKTDGWCGTNGDYATYARGEYDTLDEAREALESRFNGVRETELEYAPDGCVEAYKVGKYEKMSAQDSIDFAYAGLESDIKASTTDGGIAALLEEYEGLANAEGYTLNCTALEAEMIEMRDRLFVEAAEDITDGGD